MKHRFFGVFCRHSIARDIRLEELREELEDHLARYVDERVGAGVELVAASQEAAARLGDVEPTVELCRAVLSRGRLGRFARRQRS